MTLGRLIIESAVVLLVLAQLSRSLEISDFYDYDRSVRLENGADKYEFVQLDTPIYFYSDVHDHIYINTPGILTFGAELNGFMNEPFPLEYASIAAIAPFYSNVDTTEAGPETAISFSKSSTERNNRLAFDAVRRNFAVNPDFRVVNVLVATWENVGHFRKNNTEQNTFQVAIICGEQDTFVEFLYPTDGINWLQGEKGESGLPDIRGQSGFIADGTRYYTLPESGTENVKFLSRLSNNGRPGSWIFRVGHLDIEQNVQGPDQSQFYQQELDHPRSCAAGGNLKCAASAVCQDTRLSFSCQCRPGYYGNGFSCIKVDVPLRASGKFTGRINNFPVEAQLQSYLLLTDGRSYTAVTPIDKNVGYNSQLAYAFGSAIGWLFARPISNDNAPNGYQLTGGKLNHTTTVRYTTDDGSNYELLIVQRFNGLNVWDQLSVDIEVSGNLPEIRPNAEFYFPDTSESYVFQQENQIQSAGTGAIEVDGRNVTYIISQLINFETFREQSGEPLNTYDTQPFYAKVSKITAQYQEREAALRIGMIHKVVRNAEVNPCTDGTATCSSNSICVPDESNESYTCECKNGYFYDESQASCVDIDECASNSNNCDQNADCYNELGSYVCRCRNGFYGNGLTCYPNQAVEPSEPAVTSDPSESIETTEDQELSPTDSTPSIPVLPPDSWLCDQCSEHADCVGGVCRCRNGWNGDGYECSYNCQDSEVWNIDRCEPINSGSEEEENEIAPFCYLWGTCTCSTGYDLVEVNNTQVCRLQEKEEDLETRLPCDVENDCHQNANCEWVESETRNKCVCNPGFEGDGYECIEREVSCLFEPRICNEHASCVYDEIVGKSVCKCNKKYEGDGRSCQLASECYVDDDCGLNARCSDGVCLCVEGHERSHADECVPIGYCGGAFCAKSAVCLFDAVQSVQYCACPEGYIGDGLTECKSVPPPCNVRNNCDLNARCVEASVNVFECACNSGYYGDGFTCVPEINCANQPSLCHEQGHCISTSSGYQCVCNTGFIGNGTYCTEPYHQDSSFLLLSQGVAIVKIPTDNKRGSPIAMSGGMAIGIDKDCLTGRVYWSDITTKQIYSSKFDGSDKKSFITEGIGSPEGVAVDWISRRIYWTDSAKDTIEVASLDDPTLRTVVVEGNLVNPRGIAVDPHQGKLYWSDWNRENPKIESSDLDGTNRQVLLESPAINLPNSLAISFRTGELCYADAGTQQIGCITGYQRPVRTVVTNLSYPFGLTATSERFYWTDWTTKKIESSDEQGNRFPGIANPLFGSYKMYGVTAVTSECPLFFNQCQINNGDCPAQTICLSSTFAPSGRFCKPVN